MFVRGFKVIISELLHSTSCFNDPVLYSIGASIDNKQHSCPQVSYCILISAYEIFLRSVILKVTSVLQRLSLWHIELPNILHCKLSSSRIDLLSTQHAILGHDTLLFLYGHYYVPVSSSGSGNSASKNMRHKLPKFFM